MWSVAAQLDKMEGQYLAMFSERLAFEREHGDQIEPLDLTPEEAESLRQIAAKITMRNKPTLKITPLTDSETKAM